MPKDKFKTVWNTINILMLIYTILYMPFKIAFIDDDGISSPGAIFDYFIDAFFMLDILITFFSAYEESDGSI